MNHLRTTACHKIRELTAQNKPQSATTFEKSKADEVQKLNLKKTENQAVQTTKEEP